MQDAPTTTETQPIMGIVADIVAAYVGNNTVAADAVPGLIASVAAAVHGITSPQPEVPAEVQKEPAVSIRKSITPDYIICLEDGQKFKSLKRHLRSKYDMSPEEYRARWNLPSDYPMVAPNYSEARSNLAKSMGLGQKPQASRGGGRKKAPTAASAPKASTKGKTSTKASEPASEQESAEANA